jgi:hypothetical protein
MRAKHANVSVRLMVEVPPCAGSQPEDAFTLADHLSRQIIQLLTILRVLRASGCICAKLLFDAGGGSLRWR